MELVSVRLCEGGSAERVRLVGDVVCDDRPGKIEQYWFEVPAAFASGLSASGNPWLSCLLPLAVTLGEPLRLRAAVDPALMANASRLMEIWSGWYPGRRPIRVEADTKPSLLSGGRESAGFFSGGVDSFYMVLGGRELDARPFPAIDRLLNIWGFDIPLQFPQEYERLRSSLSRAAQALGKELLDVATNLRALRFREADWGRLAHGCALASVGLALESRFHTLCIAGTHYDGPLRPWGSHPETDPLLSTSATRVFHHGHTIPRREKTEFISRSDVAMESLHVCYQIRSADNCCECQKCILAMLTLETLGALERCRTFRRRGLDLDRVRRLYVESRAYNRLYRDLERRARAAGRTDIADALAACLKRSRRLKPLVSALGFLSEKRGTWRLARRLRKAVLAGSVP